MKNKSRLLIIIAAAAVSLSAAAVVSLHLSVHPPRYRGPGLVLLNGNVLTMDESNPRASAIVLSGEKIVYTGDNAGALAKAEAGSKVIDLRGKTVIPGFNDNHTHTFLAGQYYESPVLWQKTCREIEGIIRHEAEKKGPGALITGNSWDYTTCPDPNKSLLDRAAPRNPVMLVQYSGHAAWVNSMKLREMGIDSTTPDPKGGQIVRDTKGEPTGILRDSAMGRSLYTPVLFRIIFTNEHRVIIDRVLDLYRRAGITSVQDNTWNPFTERLLVRFLNEGRLTCRFTCWELGDSLMKILSGLLSVYDGTHVRKGPEKYFTDGAFSTRTGWMFQPYQDEPENFGSPRYTPYEIGELVMDAAKNRRQLAIHAIGDRAVHEILNAMEKARKKYPWITKLRFRLEHVQIVRPSDIPRMRDLGVLACVQPFAVSDPAKDVTLLGSNRAETAYPYRSMMKAGVPVSFGSDIPAEVDYQPLLSIYYAVTRKNRMGTAGPLNRKECLTPHEAIYCYTMGSAYAEFMETVKGSVTPGKLADLTVLDRDPAAVAPESIKDITVVMTIMGGRIVYEAR